MLAKQLSIFLENRQGRFTELAEVLGAEGINISAWCVAETAEFGILRCVVSQPEKAQEVLKAHHFAATLTPVIGIGIPNHPGALARILRILSDEGIFIEYMYSFATNGKAQAIIRPSDMDRCQEILRNKKVELLDAEYLYKI